MVQRRGTCGCSTLPCPNVQSSWPLPLSPSHISTTLAEPIAPHPLTETAAFIGQSQVWVTSNHTGYKHSLQTMEAVQQKNPCQAFVCWLVHWGQLQRSQRSLFTCLDLFAETLVLPCSLCFLSADVDLTLCVCSACVFTSTLCNCKFFRSIKAHGETGAWGTVIFSQQHILFTTIRWKVLLWFLNAFQCKGSECS